MTPTLVHPVSRIYIDLYNRSDSNNILVANSSNMFGQLPDQSTNNNISITLLAKFGNGRGRTLALLAFISSHGRQLILKVKE